MTVRRWFYALVASQALFLLGWAGWLEAELRRSPTVLLETRPVDPSEILRGDYITLNYTIGTVPISAFTAPPETDQYGEKVCVELAPAGEFWQVATASPGGCAGGEPPGEDRLRLEGRITSVGADSVALDYGIGRYYVPEGMGTPQGRLTARVAITSWSRALIKEVYLDGRPYP
ncbi:MAG TPA: GDYXXLXY domain-containing protein [Candidatus Polarisedimenticolia bacterium]|jgi:uncharacterized membrane-anchored protein